MDDEPAILELLQFTVESLTGEWETKFAESGEKALALMEKESFDLVVSDMRMPGMNGAQLLNEVMKRYPATSRIIMSGYSTDEDVIRCIGATHQFLAKPCTLSAIEATLNRIKGLRNRVKNQTIQQVVAKKDPLPSVPSVYFRLIEALQNPNCATERISEIVATDPGLTAKILQLVNSAFFGSARQISTVGEAVMFLGTGTIRSLALTLHLFSAFKITELGAEWSVEQIWRHSIRVGQSARRIAELEGWDEAMVEQVFTAGVLHDVGKLILAETLARDYLAVVERATKEACPLVEIEREVLGASHAEAGAYILDLWGLPAPLVEAVALHHEPGNASELVFTPLTAVHVANALENAGVAAMRSGEVPGLDPLYLDHLGLAARLKVWRQELALQKRD